MKFKKFLIVILILFCFPCFGFKSANDYVYLCGFPAGFTFLTRGAYVLGTCDVITNNGVESPAKDIGLKEGDLIVKIDNNEINNSNDIENSINDGKIHLLTYFRCNDYYFKEVCGVKDIFNNYKLGVYIRDCVNGIGTVSFIKGDKIYTLGHPVLDENYKLLSIIGGDIYKCSITNIKVGLRGNPGELKGKVYRENKISNIISNNINGVVGQIEDKSITKNLLSVKYSEGKIGDAFIYSTIDGDNPKYYKAQIVKTDFSQYNVKNYVIKIIDEELIKNTGGIVQGMSGSPIIQDNNIVGAITHVFVNDPTRGFGISINKMLENI